MQRPFVATLVLLSVVGCGRSKERAPEVKEPLRIAAAADLARAFEDVGRVYETRTGEKLTFTFGSTGLLAKQIREGAPFDVFAAANVSFADDVVKSGACLADTKTLYARGRIVVWAKEGEAPTLASLGDKRFVKVAIANPEHAPYGKAAKQALEKAGAWTTVSEKLVYGENVQQALQFVQSGNAEAGIVALSLAITAGGRYLEVDETLHAPLDQALVVCKGDGAKGANVERGRSFANFVGSKDGRAIMKRYGFLLPGEKLTAAP